MCDPLSAGLALTGVSMAFGAYSAYSQSEAQNKAASYNAAIQARNAQVAEMNAQNAEKQGKIDEKQKRLEVSNLMGTQRASYGGSGVLVDEGSSLDVTTDTAVYGELDALAIRNNAAMKAWAYRNQKADYEAQSNLYSMSKSSALAATGGSILSSASPLVNRFLLKG